jgi:hypothetical protein
MILWVWNLVSRPERGHLLRVRFQFLTAASMKTAVSWDIASCSFVEVNRRLRGAPWWWRRYASLKHRSNFMRLHGAIFLNAVIFTYWWCLEQSAEGNIWIYGRWSKKKLKKNTYIRRSFIICSLHQMILESSNREVSWARHALYGDNEKCE